MKIKDVIQESQNHDYQDEDFDSIFNHEAFIYRKGNIAAKKNTYGDTNSTGVIKDPSDDPSNEPYTTTPDEPEYASPGYRGLQNTIKRTQ